MIFAWIVENSYSSYMLMISTNDFIILKKYKLWIMYIEILLSLLRGFLESVSNGG